MDSKGLDFIEREPLFGLGDGFFAVEWAEFPVNEDKASVRRVLEFPDDSVAELT